jgi:YihY family inner membrane protein
VSETGPQEAPTGAGWRRQVGRASRLVVGNRVVRTVSAVVTAANTAGAPLFAAALAFSTMFATVPLLLLFSGVLGWLIDDPIARARLLADLVDRVPPLADVLADSLEGVVRTRGTLSLIGLVGLIWGSSNLYGGIDEVMRRLMPGGRARGFVERRVRGILAIVILVALVVGAISLSSVWAVFGVTIAELTVLGPALTVGLMILLVLVVYLFVPTEPPSLRAALPPAVAAGAGIGLLTLLFTVLAPLLIGGLAGFGVIATIFGAFVWLNYCYQMLLYGAAWARVRRDTQKLAGVVVSGPADVEVTE